MSQFCNTVFSQEEGDITFAGHDGRYPVYDLEPAIALANCRYGGVSITRTCQAYPEPNNLPSEVLNVSRQSEEQEFVSIDGNELVESLTDTTRTNFTVTLHHPYSDNVILVQFQKVNYFEYRVIQWNVPSYSCCQGPLQSADMFSRILTGSEVARVITSVVTPGNLNLPNEQVPITFTSSLGASEKFHLRQ